MRRSSFVTIILSLGLFAVSQGPIVAQESSGNPGISAAILAAVEAGAGQGYEVQVSRSVWEPGSSLTAEGRAGALVSCVESGSMSFALIDGAATVTRAHLSTEGIPVDILRAHPVVATSAITLGHAIAFADGDCVTVGKDAPSVFTITNAGTRDAVLWEVRLTSQPD